MSVRLWVSLLALFLVASDVASAQTPTTQFILQSAVSANGNGTAVAIQGYEVGTVQVTNPSGTPTFTINFEGSVDSATYVSVACRPPSGGALVTTATATGVWRCNVTGFRSFRARVSGYGGSGTITVTATFMAGGRSTVMENQEGLMAVQYLHAGAAAQAVLTDNHSGALILLNRSTAGNREPGSGVAGLYVKCGTNAGTLKIVAIAGTSDTEVTVVDNVGLGNAGC